MSEFDVAAEQARVSLPRRLLEGVGRILSAAAEVDRSHAQSRHTAYIALSSELRAEVEAREIIDRSGGIPEPKDFLPR